MYGEAVIAGLQGIATEVSKTADRAQDAADRIQRAQSTLATTRQDFRATGAAADDLLFRLNDLANSGETFALFGAQVEGVVAKVIDGTLSIQDAVALVGDTLVDIEGKTQRLGTVIRNTLPSIGEVQSKLQEFLKAVEGDSDEALAIIDRLRESATVAAQNIGDIGQAVLDGTADLEELIRALELLRKQGGEGGVGDLLGERLAALLREAEADGLV